VFFVVLFFEVLGIELRASIPHAMQVLYNLSSVSALFVCILFLTQDFAIFAQAGFKLMILLSLPSQWLVLQACATMPCSQSEVYSECLNIKVLNI
jgi:hypothetical protein